MSSLKLLISGLLSDVLVLGGVYQSILLPRLTSGRERVPLGRGSFFSDRASTGASDYVLSRLRSGSAGG